MVFDHSNFQLESHGIFREVALVQLVEVVFLSLLVQELVLVLVLVQSLLVLVQSLLVLVQSLLVLVQVFLHLQKASLTLLLIKQFFSPKLLLILMILMVF